MNMEKTLDVIGFMTIPLIAVSAAWAFSHAYIRPWLGGVVAYAILAVYVAIMVAVVTDRVRKGDYSLSGVGS